MKKTLSKAFGLSESAFDRSLKMFGLAASLGKSELGRLVVQYLKADGPKQDLLYRVEQAQKFVEQLGQLKGAAMKMGQLLALEARDILPDEVIQILEKLQSSAEPMDYTVVEKILSEELGHKVSLLENITAKPIASASIGQVHRAQFKGQEVAIKIQYPGVRTSVESDLKIFKQIVKTFSVIAGKNQVDYSTFFQELETMFLQETDYLQEAEATETYRLNFKENDHLIVPIVQNELSTSRVLCLSYHSGISLSDAVRSSILSKDQRYFFANTFLDLYVSEFCDWGLVQTDPNLGNFLLQPDQNRLVLLDFGATRKYSIEFRRLYSKLILSALESDRIGCLKIAQQLSLIDSRESEEALNAFADLMIQSMIPFRVNLYDFNENEYAIKMRDSTKNLIKLLKFSPPPRDILFLHRKLGGVFQILRRLEVQLDVRNYLSSYEKLASATT